MGLFFNRERKRIKELEDRLIALEIKYNCDKGKHEYEAALTSSCCPPLKAIVRCKHCWAESK